MAINTPDPNPDARAADARDSFAVYQGRLAASDQRHSADTRILWRIIRLALRYRLRVAVAIGATIVAAVFQLAIPPLLGNAVDSALGLLRGGAAEADATRDALTYAALLLLGASVLRGAFTLIHHYNGEAIGHLLSYDLRLAFYNKLQTLSFSFHDQVHTGELITRGMLDVEGVRMFINTGLLRLILLTVLIGIGAYLLLSTTYCLAY